MLSGLFNGFCFKSFQQIPYFFVLGLLLGWLYLKTDSIILTYTINAASHLLMSLLWILRLRNETLYGKIFPFVAVGGAVVALCAVAVLFKICGFKFIRKDCDGAGLKKQEARKAFFGSFAFWIFIIFAIIFIMLGKNGKPYLFKEPDPEEVTPVTQQTTAAEEETN